MPLYRKGLPRRIAGVGIFVCRWVKNSINKRAGFPRNSVGQTTPQFTPQFCGVIQDFALSGLLTESRRDEIFSAEGETLSDVKKKRFNPERMTYVAPLGLS